MNILITIVILVIILIVYASYKDAKSRNLFLERYNQFLLENEGVEIFCYTNRAIFCDEIESLVIPHIDGRLQIIKMVGKEPQTSLDKEFISYMLHNIRNVGFPNIMRIHNGKVADVSLHKTIYDALNNGKSELLAGFIEDKLKELR